MSRIGKRVITLPEKTELTQNGTILTIKGPLGELSRTINPVIEVKVNGSEITLEPKTLNIESRALWGTYGSHIQNMVKGVNEPFKKVLILEGIGFKSEVKPARPHEGSGAGGGDTIVFALGFSHPVVVKIPESLKVTAEKNVITVSGINKEEVGEFAAKIRALKKPEPYKGKGMRYEGEVIKRKQGKKSA